MQIYKDILNDIQNRMPSIPPEAGGILGGKNGQICIWEFDAGYKESGCIYHPNVEYLNNIIATWINNGFDFMGILHIHFGGSRYLSKGDYIYIEKIMNSMPNSIRQLYFPLLTQPEKSFISYRAVRNFWGNIKIKSDQIKII